MEDKKNHKGGLVVVIIILFFICGGMGCFIFMNKDKLFSTENNKDNEVVVSKEDNNKKETLDIDSAFVKSLYKPFKLDTCFKTVEKMNNDNKIRLRIAYDNIVNADMDTVLCNEIGNANSVGLSCGSSDNSKVTTSVKAEVLELKYQELFGSNASFRNEDFGLDSIANLQVHSMTYIESKNIYAEYSSEGGGTCAIGKQQLDSAYKQGNELFINTDYIGYKDDGSEYSSKIIYQFKKDNQLERYVYVKAVEE